MKADDMVLYQTFINTFNTMIENRNYFRLKWKEYLKSDNLLQIYKAKQFMRIIENVEPIEEFDMDLFFRIIDKMTVFEGRKIIVIMLGGMEIEVVIE